MLEVSAQGGGGPKRELMAEKLRIIVTGLIAQHPSLAGVAWDYLQYVVGLSRLGHDVYYLEDSGEWPYRFETPDQDGSWIAHDPTPNLHHLQRTLARFGLGDRWMYRFPIQPRWYGLSEGRRKDVIASADLLLNVSGTLDRPEDYRSVPRLAYIDTDPGFTQVKLLQITCHHKFRRRFRAHDCYFSFGECMAGHQLSAGIDWRSTRQPVLLSEWETNEFIGSDFRTVMSWTSYPPLVWEGKRFGQKDVQMASLIDLPELVRPHRLSVALGGTHHINWQDAVGQVKNIQPATLLEQNGWNVLPAAMVTNTLDSYRSFVTGSRAEFSPAKQGYVVAGTGWFSCRSACFLAAGRPVVVEDTGFGEVIPTGEGVLAFRTKTEAASAIKQVVDDPDRHAQAARNIAAEYFDASKVLPRLIDEALNTATPPSIPV